MIPVAILGGSGYTGVELMRLIAGHPQFSLVAVSSRQFSGQKAAKTFPSLESAFDTEFTDADPAALAQKAQLVFTAVPHQTAMEAVPALLQAGAKVVDLSADFRIKSQATYEQWYAPHTCPQLLAEAVYGLPEFYREQIKKARLVANPGCYVTSVLVALAPLLKAGFISPQNIIIDSASGVSGAGRSLRLDLLFGEVHDNYRPYSVNKHRHIPEMEQELSLAAGQEISISFTPHLLPIDRGIISTIYVQSSNSASALRKAWREAYGHEPFIRVLQSPDLPNTKSVRATNLVQLAVEEDQRFIKIFSALDNLTKGASGQAIQNANLMLGLPEQTGLTGLAAVP